MDKIVVKVEAGCALNHFIDEVAAALLKHIRVQQRLLTALDVSKMIIAGLLVIVCQTREPNFDDARFDYRYLVDKLVLLYDDRVLLIICVVLPRLEPSIQMEHEFLVIRQLLERP